MQCKHCNVLPMVRPDYRSSRKGVARVYGLVLKLLCRPFYAARAPKNLGEGL